MFDKDEDVLTVGVSTWVGVGVGGGVTVVSVADSC